MNIVTFETEKDARDHVMKAMTTFTKSLLTQVQPDRPNFSEGENPIFVYTGDRIDPRVEFIIAPYEIDGVYGIRLEIPNIESAIDYIIHTNNNKMISESTIQIAFHAESIGKVLETDQAEGTRRAGKFAFIEAYIQSALQGLIDHSRGWSPYGNANEYVAAMHSDDPLPTKPKVFFPDHGTPERYHDPNEEE